MATKQVRHCLADSRVRGDGSPRLEAEWPKRSSDGGDEERVREARVSDEDDGSNSETAAVVPRRLLQHHSQAPHFHIQRAGA